MVVPSLVRSDIQTLWGERILVRGLKLYFNDTEVPFVERTFGANESSSGD